jgi:hypothetical protein
LTEGSLVVIFIASIRAVARIVSMRSQPGPDTTTGGEESGEMFSFDQCDDVPTAFDSSTVILFAFTATREWIETGTKVLVMPAATRVTQHHPGLTRDDGTCGRMKHGDGLLEGFVGKITEAYDE